MEKAEQDGWTPRLLLLQDPSAEVEELLQKHKRLERCLEAQVEKISTLEATVHSLYQGRNSETQKALARNQAVL